MTWLGMLFRLLAFAAAWTWLAANGLVLACILLMLAGFIDEIMAREKAGNEPPNAATPDAG